MEAIEDTDLVARLHELRPVTYNWIEGGEKAMGLIAQEVQEVFPFMVSGGGDETLTVDYSQLISPMLARIQRLDRDLDAEKQKNAELMAILGSMEERLQALEALSP